MAAHSVKLKVEHPLTVGNVGVEIRGAEGRQAPRKARGHPDHHRLDPGQGRNPRKVSWQEFGDWMESRGNRRDGSPRAAPHQDRETNQGVAEDDSSSDDVPAVTLEPLEEPSRSTWV